MAYRLSHTGDVHLEEDHYSCRTWGRRIQAAMTSPACSRFPRFLKSSAAGFDHPGRVSPP